MCDELSICKIAFADNHIVDSPELEYYPSHCVSGTNESDIVSELKDIGGYKLIHKNSTSGFLEEDFQKWLNENSDIDIYIVAGCCTDICIQQFTITLKTWFNKQNRKSRVVVPINAVETYDFEVHDGDLMHLMGLYNMNINGIELVAEIN